MENITGNEPANPTDHVITDSFGNIEGIEQKRWSGLTIRQHFAAIAMQGMLAACNGYTGDHLGNLAKCAVSAADNLIERLNAPTPSQP